MIVPRVRAASSPPAPASVLRARSFGGGLLLEEHRIRRWLRARRRLLLGHGENQGKRLLLIDGDGAELRGDVCPEEVGVLEDRVGLMAGEQAGEEGSQE